MRLACMFSSILLFGAAGLLLFISLQDPTELAPQQVPGEPPPPRFPTRGPDLTAGQMCWARGMSHSTGREVLASIAMGRPLLGMMERLPICLASCCLL